MSPLHHFTPWFLHFNYFYSKGDISRARKSKQCYSLLLQKSAGWPKHRTIFMHFRLKKIAVSVSQRVMDFFTSTQTQAPPYLHLWLSHSISRPVHLLAPLRAPSSAPTSLPKYPAFVTFPTSCLRHAPHPGQLSGRGGYWRNTWISLGCLQRLQEE